MCIAGRCRRGQGARHGRLGVVPAAERGPARAGGARRGPERAAGAAGAGPCRASWGRGAPRPAQLRAAGAAGTTAPGAPGSPWVNRATRAAARGPCRRSLAGVQDCKAFILPLGHMRANVGYGKLRMHT